MGYYVVRQLNKEKNAQFEQNINSANINFQEIQALVQSKFASQIHLLNVQIPQHFPFLTDLCYLTPNFFPNVENINIVFVDCQQRIVHDKILEIDEPLNFRNLNIISINKQSQCDIESKTFQFENKSTLFLTVRGGHDVTISNSNFQGIGLKLENNNCITVSDTNFRDAPSGALGCTSVHDKIKISNVFFQNCQLSGICIIECQNKVDLKNINMTDCSGCGFAIAAVNEFQLEDVVIENCYFGIACFSSNGKIQNILIKNFIEGLNLANSTIFYKHVQFVDGDSEQNVKSNSSEFVENL